MEACITMEMDMLPVNDGDRYETTSFRSLGWLGAFLFTFAPPIFFYQYWLVFYTTAVEENPSIGPVMAISCVAMFASIPMMIAGRSKTVSATRSVEALRMPSMRRRDPRIVMEPGQAPQ
ncbi:hypothetical protein [Aureimonas leprariae]|uniref:Uncharacterized protein n=1 Tax=Plantimonas leprariae TaxID=2615207 RepID=A0A7V7PMC8_9HYPH|nr:hypothetical protein [Aureimonas leprariae]KAB0678075.1 hypothetical protein F6X38_16755 [Aureimonas leprariae]